MLSKSVLTIVLIASSHVALQLQRLRIKPAARRCGLPQSRHGFTRFFCAPRSNVAKFQECVAATSAGAACLAVLLVKTQARALQKASLSTREVASVKLAGMFRLGMISQRLLNYSAMHSIAKPGGLRLHWDLDPGFQNRAVVSCVCHTLARRLPLL